MQRILPDSDHTFDTSELSTSLGLTSGGTVWLATRPRRPEGGWTALGRLRLALSEAAQRNGDLVLGDAPRFLWVTEFPLFTRADEDKEFLAHGRWSSSHHPFTAPMFEDVKKMYAGRIEDVRGQHYDLVLNGVEIGGGSVRVHDAAMQEYIFREILQVRYSIILQHGSCRTLIIHVVRLSSTRGRSRHSATSCMLSSAVLLRTEGSPSVSCYGCSRYMRSSLTLCRFRSPNGYPVQDFVYKRRYCLP